MLNTQSSTNANDGNAKDEVIIDFEYTWQKGDNIGYLWAPSVICGWCNSLANDKLYEKCKSSNSKFSDHFAVFETFDMSNIDNWKLSDVINIRIGQNQEEKICILKILNKNESWDEVQHCILNFHEKHNLIVNNNDIRLTTGFQQLIDQECEFLEIENLLQECKIIFDNVQINKVTSNTNET